MDSERWADLSDFDMGDHLPPPEDPAEPPRQPGPREPDRDPPWLLAALVVVVVVLGLMKVSLFALNGAWGPVLAVVIAALFAMFNLVLMYGGALWMARHR